MRILNLTDMKVKIRHIEYADSVNFSECKDENALNILIGFIKRSGGVYHHSEGACPFHSYQIVCGEDESFVEIIIGEES